MALALVLVALLVTTAKVGLRKPRRFLQGDTCPIETVSLRGAALGDDAETEVDADCRFELTPPEGASELTVVAEGPGFCLEERISIPAQGDPDPICLNTP